ncbi:MAG: S8 family peptidase [Deltaproteobacteria bacterium]|nr:S8 family peptidase [Deltaproteobacteria bacterium]
MIETAIADAALKRATIAATIPRATPGANVRVESPRGFDLKTSTLQPKRGGKGIDILAMHTDAGVQSAVVFIPEASAKYLYKRLDDYAKKPLKSKARKHRDFVERIARTRAASLRDVWTDDPATFPSAGQLKWWEVWLRRGDGNELTRLRSAAGQFNVPIAKECLFFEERVVVLARATVETLETLFAVSGDIAELRLPNVLASDFSELPPAEQPDWVEELLDRLSPPGRNAPAVCILDSGVNRGHPLLKPALNAADMHTCDQLWRADDDRGHGTQMAGLALYGDLTIHLAGTHALQMSHVLESVKILPPPPLANDPRVYGMLTAEAVSRVEIQAAARKRCFMLAVLDESRRDRGKPTSWSAAVDALACGGAVAPDDDGLLYLDGNEPGEGRIFVVAAGNVNTTEVDHLTRSDLEVVHDPAQAWNALTVGAFTEKATVDVNDATLAGYTTLAPAGELSPYSSTSRSCQPQWPIKPDVVMEGGNKVCPPSRSHALQADCVSLLTTHHKPAERLLTTTWATSAACAQAARMAATIGATYPALWPETVRGLIVHSAEWTDAMHASLKGKPSRRDRENLVRRYGFGVPSLDRALRSARSATTLIVQDRLSPFANKKMKELHIHELPWPTDVLAALGETAAQVRVTLSYFIEPNPASTGWQRRHRYASHGFRFELNTPTESVSDFRKRLNELALDEDEEAPKAPDRQEGWFLGEDIRSRGSLHSDYWVGTAADLAARGHVAVVPRTGWWKDRANYGRLQNGARYSLLLSIETERTDVDIWTPIANAVEVRSMVEA